MNKIFLITLFALANTCFSMHKSNSSYDEVMRSINKHSKELRKEGLINRWYGLHYISRGKIEEISLGYSIDKNLKYAEARQYFYRIVDSLLERINSNEKIKDHFYHYPVTYNDLHFSISFDYEGNHHLKKDDIRQAVIQDNQIAFHISNYDGASNKLVAHETYPGMGTLSIDNEEAFRWVRENLPKTKESTNLIK